MGVGVIVMEVPRISFRSAIFVCTVLEPVMPTADLTRELFRCAFSNILARGSGNVAASSLFFHEEGTL